MSNDGVAKLPRLSHATCRRSHGRVDGGVDVVTTRPTSGTLLIYQSGRTDADGLVWARPFSCGEFTTDERFLYEVVELENTTPFDLRVEVLAEWDFDGFLHAYTSFDPSAPNAGCIDANDDFDGTASSRLVLDWPSGVTLDMVLSSYSAGSAGNYELFVTVL